MPIPTPDGTVRRQSACPEFSHVVRSWKLQKASPAQIRRGAGRELGLAPAALPVDPQQDPAAAGYRAGRPARLLPLLGAGAARQHRNARRVRRPHAAGDDAGRAGQPGPGGDPGPVHPGAGRPRRVPDRGCQQAGGHHPRAPAADQGHRPGLRRAHGQAGRAVGPLRRTQRHGGDGDDRRQRRHGGFPGAGRGEAGRVRGSA